MNTIRLTAAQAMVHWLAAQRVEGEGGPVPFFAGVWAIFGHGNVAGLGEALHGIGDALPTYRAHNEQGMAHAAIAFAKASNRRRAMVCTSSIGPGATNMVTAAALAHVNRLPVLFLPGDIFASRRPDPVLQQVEDFGDGTVSANDCFRPVSRYFDRIMRAEQLLDALPRVMAVLTDPADCGPVTLAFCQDTQAEAYDWPESFFEPRLWHFRRVEPDPRELSLLRDRLAKAERPLIIAGGGVHYSGAAATLADFARATGVPVAETQAGKGALPWDHPANLGAIGVTGSEAANKAADEADLIIGIGTRLADFTTGSRRLIHNQGRDLVQVNVVAFDAFKQGALPVVGDAGRVLELLSASLSGWMAPAGWVATLADARVAWDAQVEAVTAPPAGPGLPTDAQVIGAVQRAAADDAIVVCAAGGLPGDLHKLWRVKRPGGYHMEYGYSCMGYEIAGGVGVAMAQPQRPVHVMVGDGSYLMMNSELAVSVMLGTKLIVTLLDNRGFGCINRLQAATGGAPFNNLLADARHRDMPRIDFAAHAASLGAIAEKVADIAELEAALARARTADRSTVIVIDTDPRPSDAGGGAWWDVAVPETSTREQVRQARAAYQTKINEGL
ncbi:3D-(3,5/4)-trihydroxycyclohexane-1,2-dione acylhydrolase (decyclizing) [Niveispirillum cyanobacteriorum]|uniref:3D-(3,5/4)-trihydroxycyclohexane-1,2-dione acylhydrolase (Decyclizing) n=1 Tax=Niveispirillum cyanobacteriorum TaxID=1612173 RepID=A0A2K9NGH8_9PROT|nr:3D-(3,5/4)-trihydroxycyclohexane-1,2-dione acylhydrolase (decyclizing) [Niveispirillum cyanobacteriorum]AUN32208.1 3D-(3,5/4)-trihydroxycyclohexane-1,2-dione acylhydrolase (decyclizing) [Niveispirillum cyanobacteriorum]GGE75195.1 3D-(3,5/4)-trihydroxycyclohexane-1,2-dione acylhydrolase (decyclizing) [Niveispirillum cyanobacteriorum]